MCYKGRPQGRPFCFLRAPDAAQRVALREAVRCRAGAVMDAGVWYGPGSAERHEECRTASGTRDFLVHPQKIPLADLDAVVAQDAVGSGGMEVKIREGEMADELLALQGHGAVGASGKLDVAVLRAVELRGLEAVHICDCLRQPLLQFGKGFFGVGRRRHFTVRHPRATLRGEIRRELDLLAQRQHVRKKPRRQQHLGLDVFRCAMRLGFVEKSGKAVENLQEGGNGSVIERHVMLFSLDEECSRAPDAAQRVALAKWCAAEPGPYQAPVFGTVPALRSGMKNAAPRPGHGVSCGWTDA